jgi:hypothetical protein
MAGNLDQILRGIGAGRGKKRDDDVIDEVSALIHQIREGRTPGPPFVARAEAEHAGRDGARIRAGQAHHSNPGSSWRRGDCRDGFENQCLKSLR